MARKFTEEEIVDQFLKHVSGLIDYWEGKSCQARTNYPCRKRLEGLAFSILVTLDGGSANLPKFIVAPDPHPDDRDFHKSRGENWHPENHTLDVCSDISGGLHELLHRYIGEEESDG